ncbi:MAG: DUF2924 domain-containing protein [Planctomycetes bacterium]|nr:DUF2924 domain-containing protein [Planctomycetota bacterium]MCG2685294.1 DUF2924 domain-containing protein [Planctomycetales bacterium]
MNLNIGKELATLQRMSVNELRMRYVEVFGEATNTRHKDWLIKRVIWRMQALAEGDLTERARRRAEELANDADLRCKPPRAPSATTELAQTSTRKPATNGDSRIPLPATIITRVYKGETLQVRVLPAGFEYEGEVYKSLSAVAKKITGTHCNGYLFFNLTKDGGVR